jgi:hypothetical protein
MEVVKMIKKIETYYSNNELLLKIEYDTDKELEFKNDVREYIDNFKKDIKNKDIEWDLIELSLDVSLMEKINKIKEKLGDSVKVKGLEFLILALIQMRQTWEKLKQKLKEKFKVLDYGDVLFVYM